MAEKLEDWLNGEVKELQKLPVAELSNTFFFRDPVRPILNKVINPNNMDYLKFNERMFNQVYVPSLDYTYYIIQIADEDVNVIAPFKKQQDFCTQNERFSLIRWGSQVDLVLPLDERFNFDILLEETMHVNAGLDKLIKIRMNNDLKSPHRRSF
jgi:phosphatidylserine decarboxylase